jgi:hypothetical protein
MNSREDGSFPSYRDWFIPARDRPFDRCFDATRYLVTLSTVRAHRLTIPACGLPLTAVVPKQFARSRQPGLSAAAATAAFRQSRAPARETR